MSSRLVICKGKSCQLTPSGDRNIGPRLTCAYCKEGGTKSNEYLSPLNYIRRGHMGTHLVLKGSKQMEIRNSPSSLSVITPSQGTFKNVWRHFSCEDCGGAADTCWVEALMLLPAHGMQDCRIPEGPSSSHEDRAMGCPATKSNGYF